MEPDVSGSELLRVLYAVLGKIGARIVAWGLIAVGLILVSPRLVTSLKDFWKELSSFNLFEGDTAWFVIVNFAGLILALALTLAVIFAIAFPLVFLFASVLNRIQSEQNRRDREALEQLRQTMLARSSITKEDRDALSKFPTPPPTRNYQHWWLRFTGRGPKTDDE